jgi:Ser/Thr protein kinase RdoA (MazF antagonist)
MSDPRHRVTELPGVALARRALALWNGEQGSLEPLGSSENAVYRFRQRSQSRILRLTSPEHRSLEQIDAELEFVRHLRTHGVRACDCIPSSDGREIETIDGFMACVFEAATGTRFRLDAAADATSHFRSVGRTLGRIHTLSRGYQPVRTPRFHWRDDPTIALATELVPRHDDVVWREYEWVMAWLDGQPSDAGRFGLIHGDFGPTNYLGRDGELSVFDFDDACYHWYAYDVAITIYPHGWRQQVRALYDALIEGYSAEAPWEARPLEAMTPWCRLRLLYMYLHGAYRWRDQELPDAQAEWMRKTRENIARGYSFATRAL